MTSISPVSNAASAASAKTNALTSQLGQMDFLRLMTEQLRQQDPTNPADSTQMTVQMAQFASAGGIAEMTQSLKLISDRLASQTKLLEQIEAATKAAAAQTGQGQGD
jgi:flagellar hook assembly protein FlgD